MDQMESLKGNYYIRGQHTFSVKCQMGNILGLTQVTQAWIKVNAFAVGNERCFLRNIFKNRNLIISILPNVCCILITF